MEKQWRKSLKTRAIALFSLIFLGFWWWAVGDSNAEPTD
jgi:cbb3-type cytochrome oxidase subunit 3